MVLDAGTIYEFGYDGETGPVRAVGMARETDDGDDFEFVTGMAPDGTWQTFPLEACVFVWPAETETVLTWATEVGKQVTAASK